MSGRAAPCWLAVLLLLGAALPGHGADAGRVAIAVNDVRGTPPGAPEVRLAAGDGFTLGYLIATGKRSEALLTFDPRGSLRLGAEARVTIDRATIDASGRSQNGLSVLVGRLWVALSRLFQGELVVETPTATIGIKGTLVMIEVLPSGETRVVVIEGVVSVQGKALGEPLLVGPGQQTTVAPGGLPTPPAPTGNAVASLSPSAGGPGSPAAEPPDPGDLVDLLLPNDRGNQ
ncbi:MAG TPA: FecR domain-containing protein [Thermoanaerobaculia bacterium]|nr:FecR domain-containing protein [Thermoanaerobaculia bacterium]